MYTSLVTIADMTYGTNNLVTTNTGHAFMPQTPETFQHDADGNLTRDVRKKENVPAQDVCVQCGDLTLYIGPGRESMWSEGAGNDKWSHLPNTTMMKKVEANERR